MVTVEKRTKEGKTAAAMYQTLAINSSDNKSQILFPHAVGAASEKRGAAADIAFEINKALCLNRIPSHVRIQRLMYNEKGNLSGLAGLVATSNMLLLLHCEALQRAARKWGSDIIDVTGDQIWY